MLSDDSMQSQGGKARAEALTAEQRAEIARKAAEARWGLPKATHTGEIRIGNAIIRCAVLEGGVRVLTQYDVLRAIGRSGKPAGGRGTGDFAQFEKPSPLFDAENLKPFVPSDLVDSKPMEFRVPTGSRAWGYRAEILPQVCEVYLDARDAGALRKNQEKFATACAIIIRGLARVGIVALVDEATGYQEVRDKQALAKILERYLMAEARKWERMFQIDYYRELFRLQGWTFNPDTNARTPYLGRITNNIIYDRLQPGILKKLNELNPPMETRTGKKRRKHTFHSFFTGDVGVPELKEHLSNVTVLMKVSKDWSQFMDMLDKVKPRVGDTLKLNLEYSESRK